VGISGRQINFAIVNIDGSAPAAETGIQLLPSGTTTSQKGFNLDPIILDVAGTATKGALYLVKATYLDGATQASSYGPYVYVTESTDLSASERDFLLSRKVRLPDRC
jgi:hypothetical protein